MSAKRYLVTGGSGFIGAALVKRLVRLGCSVRVLDNHSRGALRRIEEVLPDIDVIECDIRDADRVRAAAKDVDCVVHLAYVNGTEFFYRQPELVLDIAVRGMLAVLDACRANGVRELVLASSSEVYQMAPNVPTAEDVALSVPDVTNPRYSYGGGKIVCELMALNYGLTGFERVTVFRPHNVYGPDMGWEHVIPQFVLRAVEQIAAHPRGPVPFPIQGDGSHTRAFVHIDDFTDGLLCVLDRGKHLNVYHIGNPEEVAIGDLAKRVLACLHREAEIVPGDLPRGAPPRRAPDIAKLCGLGYSPRIPLAAGLPPVVEWYASHANLRPR